MIDLNCPAFARTLGVAAAAGLLAAACVSGSGSTPAVEPTSLASVGAQGVSQTPAVRFAPSTSLPSAPESGPSSAGTRNAGAPTAGPAVPAGTRELTESNKGQTLTVSTGATVTLVLHNVYWTVHASPDPSVLAAAGAPVYSGAGTMSCIPGSGCGTVTATFNALAPGRVLITATRTTCGQEVACTGDLGTFDVTVVVEN